MNFKNEGKRNLHSVMDFELTELWTREWKDKSSKILQPSLSNRDLLSNKNKKTISPLCAVKMCLRKGKNPAAAGRATDSPDFIAGRRLCGGVKEMIKTCKICREVKVPPSGLFGACVGGLRAPWLNISHEPEHNPERGCAVGRQWSGRGRWSVPECERK